MVTPPAQWLAAGRTDTGVHPLVGHLRPPCWCLLTTAICLWASTPRDFASCRWICSIRRLPVMILPQPTLPGGSMPSSTWCSASASTPMWSRARRCMLTRSPARKATPPVAIPPRADSVDRNVCIINYLPHTQFFETYGFQACKGSSPEELSDVSGFRLVLTESTLRTFFHTDDPARQTFLGVR